MSEGGEHDGLDPQHLLADFEQSDEVADYDGGAAGGAAATAYYQANIGSVKTPSDLVNNYRLFSYAMNAYGLGDMTSTATGLIQKVLEQGTGSQSNLAYTLNNPQILAFAKAFDFADNGTSTTSSTAVQTGVVNNYITQTLDANQGQSDPAFS